MKSKYIVLVIALSSISALFGMSANANVCGKVVHLAAGTNGFHDYMKGTIENSNFDAKKRVFTFYGSTTATLLTSVYQSTKEICFDDSKPDAVGFVYTND